MINILFRGSSIAVRHSVAGFVKVGERIRCCHYSESGRRRSSYVSLLDKWRVSGLVLSLFS